ncbi:succinate-semialdehyde dehydrogenase (NAD(P)(+)) [Pichia kluyveri]|uniref:Succinate-semialdehyde dehydrogenase n=1 Tax=Pichia kluyveri TaxID=36015 RepID=A0AAV5R8H6_PICKL|nr:succinate-semialdehyde dehydrogenase (NAD(P)(+)) [Pichia kluyveri]
MSSIEEINAFATKYGIKNANLIKTGALVNGEWIVDNSEVFSVEDPANGEHLINVTNTKIEVIEQGIKDSQIAFKKFLKESTGRQRGRILRKFYDLMLENFDDLAIICTIENGKSLADSKGEITYASSFFEWFSEEAPRIYADNIPSATASKRIITSKQPIGVVGILTPWNFPSAMITRKLGAAFAAGCSTVIKPATETPLSALALGYLAQEAGFPKGMLSMFPVDQERTKEVGKLFCESPIIKKISFTGSTGVGKLLMTQSAQTLKKLSFELGGNAPFIVFEDADVDVAVKAALGCKLRQSGQTCICANRLYIHEDVYDEFSTKLTKEVSKYVLGHGLDPNTTHGPLIHERAVQKVESHIDDAISKGAEILLGGKKAPHLGPNFHDLTILGNVPKDALVNKDETFGPLVPLIKFKTEEEVLELANDTEYGLAGYFFSKNYSRIFRVGEQLNCGMIGANTGALGEASLPFGGIGWSGFGREGSKYGIDDYTVIKSIVIDGI